MWWGAGLGLSALCVCGGRELSLVEVCNPGTGEWTEATQTALGGSTSGVLELERVEEPSQRWLDHQQSY